MSDHDFSDKAKPAASAEPVVSASPVRSQAPQRGNGAAAFALLLALLALLGAAYVGWRQWQPMTGDAVSQLQQRIDALTRAQSAQQAERSALSQSVDEANRNSASLHAEMQNQTDRLRALEDAVARLSANSQSGHDTVLLDETESLLRMGADRYALFHDAGGAAQAYAQAAQSLGAVSDGSYAGLRQSIDSERQALEKAAQSTPAGVQQALSQLRASIETLPLKPLDVDAANNGHESAWMHIRKALVGLISVRRDDGSLSSIGDARLVRELVRLDLAQAQASLLAFDNAAAISALQQARQGLAGQFDAQSNDVRQTQAQLDTLLGQLTPTTTSVNLGGALAELHNLRAVHAAAPSTPAAAASTAGGAAR